MAKKKAKPDATASGDVVPTPEVSPRSRTLARIGVALKKPPGDLTDQLVLFVNRAPAPLDSMGVWDLMVALEEEFGLTGKLTDINKIVPLTVGQVVAVVEKVLKGS